MTVGYTIYRLCFDEIKLCINTVYTLCAVNSQTQLAHTHFLKVVNTLSLGPSRTQAAHQI